MRKICLAVLLIMVSAQHVRAGWFDFDKKEDKKKAAAPVGQQSLALRRYHLTVPDKKTERELVGLIRGRRMLKEDIMVLRRMTQDRRARFTALQKQLKDKFGILPEERYEYDREKKELLKIVMPKSDKEVEVKPKPAGKDGENGFNEDDLKVFADESTDKEKRAEPKKRLFKKFDEKEAEEFLAIQIAKSRRSQDIMVFQRSMLEEEVQLKKINELMSKRFAMKEEKYYDYDPKEMKLYEMTPQRQMVQPRK